MGSQPQLQGQPGPRAKGAWEPEEQQLWGADLQGVPKCLWWSGCGHAQDPGPGNTGLPASGPWEGVMAGRGCCGLACRSLQKAKGLERGPEVWKQEIQVPNFNFALEPQLTLYAEKANASGVLSVVPFGSLSRIYFCSTWQHQELLHNIGISLFFTCALVFSKCQHMFIFGALSICHVSQRESAMLHTCFGILKKNVAPSYSL